MRTVRVAAAVIRDGDRIFATQRGYGDYKDWWEFPGGKLELDETAEEALHREIREELNTEITIGGHIMTVEYDYPKFHLVMDCFWCVLAGGEPELLEHEAAAWLGPDELMSVKWLPSDTEVIEKIAAWFGREYAVLICITDDAAVAAVAPDAAADAPAATSISTAASGIPAAAISWCPDSPAAPADVPASSVGPASSAAPAILLEVRSMLVRQPGEICLPGGRMEKGETPEMTAIRETSEELRIAPEDIEITGKMDPMITSDGRKVHPVLAKVSRKTLAAINPSKAEVSEAFLLPMDWLRENPPAFIDLATTSDEELPPKLAEYLAHYGEFRKQGSTDYWEYEGRAIWGLTARILKKYISLELF